MTLFDEIAAKPARPCVLGEHLEGLKTAVLRDRRAACSLSAALPDMEQTL